jgi:Thiolase, N-terminal domain.
MSMGDTWLVPGLRTPFARVDGALRASDGLALSVPVAKAMAAQLPAGERPDLVVWGTVVPNLGWSNLARELVVKPGIDPAAPAFSTVLACSTSMTAVFEAAGVQQAVGEDVAALGVGAELDLVDRQELDLAPQRHGLDRCRRNSAAGAGRSSPRP